MRTNVDLICIITYFLQFTVTVLGTLFTLVLRTLDRL